MTTANEAGYYEWTLDGAALLMPRVYEPHDILSVATTQTAGRPRQDAWWCGDGLPNVGDRWEWLLEYGLSDSEQTTTRLLARLRTQGGTHDFVDWKARLYTYTARSGQQFFYLPRPDAFSAQYAGHTTQATYGAQVWLNDVAQTVVYKATVASGDTVPSGEVWIGDTAVTHSEAGFLCAPFKLGTATAIYDDILVEYYPLYRVAVSSTPSVPFEMVGIEERSLVLVEVAGV